MTLRITHKFRSTIPDDLVAKTGGEVTPSNWNDDHRITGTLPLSWIDMIPAWTVIGNPTGGVGAPQVLTGVQLQAMIGRGGSSVTGCCPSPGPGEMGEFFSAQATIPYPMTTPLNTTVNIGTLPPGDWDAWSFATINVPTAGTPFLDQMDYYLNPLPAGISHPMGFGFAAVTAGAAVSENLVMTSPHARANVQVPTPLIYTVFILSTGGSGSITLYTYGRRWR